MFETSLEQIQSKLMTNGQLKTNLGYIQDKQTSLDKFRTTGQDWDKFRTNKKMYNNIRTFLNNWRSFGQD